MKQILFALAVTALTFNSCSKSTDRPSPLKESPLTKVIDRKYITISGSEEVSIDYKSYKPSQELDKTIMKAAQDAVDKGFYTRVLVVGKTITSIFKANTVMPSSYRLNSDTEYYKKASNITAWKGRLIIRKTNNLVSKADFEKGVDIQVRALNTFDEAKILEKGVTDNTIIVTFAITKTNASNPTSVSFQVQSNVAVTYSVNYQLTDILDGYGQVEADVVSDLPTTTSIGNNTTQFKGQLHFNGAKDASLRWVADWYWRNYVVPTIQ